MADRAERLVAAGKMIKLYRMVAVVVHRSRHPFEVLHSTVALTIVSIVGLNFKSVRQDSRGLATKATL
jgi:hypothetical protein